MNVQICMRSMTSGLALGILFTGSAWYGETLADRSAITKELLTQAKCDDTVIGWSSIVFADGSQYTCTPKMVAPPTSKEEAEARAQRQRKKK